MKRRDENKWVDSDHEKAKTMHLAGSTPEDIGAAINKTPGSVRAVLHLLGYIKSGAAPVGVKREPTGNPHIEAAAQNGAFERAMRSAIKNGKENAPIGVVKDFSPSHGRRLYSDEPSYGSPAAMCSE